MSKKESNPEPPNISLRPDPPPGPPKLVTGHSDKMVRSGQTRNKAETDE